MHSRDATTADAPAIAAIYNEGIDDRVATFETRHRSPDDVAGWLNGKHPVVVAEEDDRIVAFASTSTYRPRDCYDHIAEFSVYVARAERERGAGRMAMLALFESAKRAGITKLVSRVFTTNAASRALLASLGFREVGIYERHGQLDGSWRDVVIVERLLDDQSSSVSI
jgi:L-amino acid N-acyltransferase YncA